MTSDHEQLERSAHMLSRFIGTRHRSLFSAPVFIIAPRPFELLPNTNLVIVIGIIVRMSRNLVEGSPYSEDVA